MQPKNVITFTSIWNSQTLSPLKELSRSALLKLLKETVANGKDISDMLKALPLELREYIGRSFCSLKCNEIKSHYGMTCMYGHTDAITCMSNHEKFVITGSKDKTVKIWNIDDNICLQTLEHDDEIFRVALNINLGLAVVVTIANNVYIWNFRTSEVVYKNRFTYPVYNSTIIILENFYKVLLESLYDSYFIDIETLDISIVKPYFVKFFLKHICGTVTVEHDIVFYKYIDEIHREASFRFQGHEANINDIDISSNGKVIISCSGDNRLIGWNTDMQECIFNEFLFCPLKLAFVTDNDFIAISVNNLKYFITYYTYTLYYSKPKCLVMLNTGKSASKYQIVSLKVVDCHVIIGMANITNNIQIKYHVYYIFYKYPSLYKMCYDFGIYQKYVIAPSICEKSVVCCFNNVIRCMNEKHAYKPLSLHLDNSIVSIHLINKTCLLIGTASGSIYIGKLEYELSLEQFFLISKLEKCKVHYRLLEYNEYYLKILGSFEVNLLKCILIIYSQELESYKRKHSYLNDINYLIMDPMILLKHKHIKRMLLSPFV
jgi:WD40 repeat protein